MLISPRILLDSMGGFSERNYLSLFRSIDEQRLEELIRSTTPEDWGRPGELGMRDFLAPLKSQTFPRTNHGKFGWAMESALKHERGIDDPLIRCYCAVMHLHAEVHHVSTGYEALPESCAILYEGLKPLGFYYKMESAKFLLWLHDIACAPFNRDWDPRVVLALRAFMLVGNGLVDFGETCRNQVISDGWRDVDTPASRRSVSEEANQLLASSLRDLAAPNGAINRTLQQLLVAVLDGNREAIPRKDEK